MPKLYVIPPDLMVHREAIRGYTSFLDRHVATQKIIDFSKILLYEKRKKTWRDTNTCWSLSDFISLCYFYPLAKIISH
jgi:hypothetical protein